MRPARGLLVLLLTVGLAGCAPANRPGTDSADADRHALSFDHVRALADRMLGRIRVEAERIASFGPRQTGQIGCARTYEYIRNVFADLDGDRGTLREFGSTVTVPLDRHAADPALVGSEHSSLEVLGLSDEPQVWEASSFYPNNVQDCRTRQADGSPRRLIDIGMGGWSEMQGKSFADTVVLLDYNSGDAWLRAKELGAYAAIVVEPSWTNWRQSDLKYLDMVPLDMPRLYISRQQGDWLREALAAGRDVRVVVRSLLQWVNVHAPCVEFTVAGADPTRTYIIVSHFDARSIVPDLAFGGDEVWGTAALLELARHFAQPDNRPPVNLRFMAVAGTHQAQRPLRDYLAYGQPGFDEAGNPVQLVMGLDFSTEESDLNLIRESAWDHLNAPTYQWLRQALFRTGGWHERIYAGLDLPRRGVNFYAGMRPFIIRTADDDMAPRRWLCPATFAPKFPTANEPWDTLGIPTFAFQTASLYRLHHNSPLDHFAASNTDPRFANLRPQIEITLAVLDRLLHFPARKIAPAHPSLKRRANWGGYVQARGRIQVWDASTGWFSTELPVEPTREGREGQARKRLRTFIYANSTDAAFLRAQLGARSRAFLGWPLAPGRRQHRELQSFMFREIRLLDEPTFRLNAIYAYTPPVEIDVLGYALDEEGRLLYATDFGVHGDGSPAFQATDVSVNYWDLFVPVTLFPCGSVELYGLYEVEKRSHSWDVFGQYYLIYASPGNHQDRGAMPYIPVSEVKNAESHTDMRSWGAVQCGPTAMVFLPARTESIVGQMGPQRAEILVGNRLAKFTPLLNVDERGVPRGYAVEHGQTIRVNPKDRPAAAEYAWQQFAFDRARLAEFARHDVASPLASQYHAETAEALEGADAAAARRDWRVAFPGYLWAWTTETKAYQYTIGLLLDVVSTTVLYFTLLIPFAFLVERLVLPQPNAVRTALVAGVVFLVFVAVLYMFHPGFQLANNILVTIIAFLIVVMTIPALILLVMRGIGMLKAMGSRAIILQRSEAEKAGVVSASLSLSVSNMRRRKLRTTLTLATITTLVIALVLLTTSTAFEFSLVEPQELSATTFYGIQLYNATDRTRALLPEAVEMLEGILADEALVLRRDYVNYGYDPEAETGALSLRANGHRVAVPYLQLMTPEDARIEYRLPATEDDPRETVHLNELMRGPEGEPVWFDADDVNVVLLPSNMAEQLGVRPGDTVEFMGVPLTVRGVWESRAVKRDEAGNIVLDVKGQPITSPGLLDRLNDLNAQPITPLRFAVVTQGDPDKPFHTPSSDMIILPRRFHEVHRMLPVNTFSLIVVPHDSARIPELAGRLSKRVLNADVFYHYVEGGQDRIAMINLREATQVKGSGMMVFMLAIAVLMILAIMMGTVHERMREINIFSSVGLAPRHVAGMFLIESLVYAGIASVLGYFLGIVALTIVSSAGWLPENFYPNYLGVYVLYAIGIAMFATVASSLYPIRVAAQMVNPSLERSWRIGSEPEDGQWRIVLPFIATTTAEARGLMVYAYEFLAVHQGERSGQFVCQTPPAPVVTGRLPGVEMDVWLAPFERNITQWVRLQVEPGERPGRWAFVLYLEHRSGPEYLWQRSNRAFVNELRKHLLNWRAMSPQQIELFMDQGMGIFEMSTPA